jgi:hypothetical protein
MASVSAITAMASVAAITTVSATIMATALVLAVFRFATRSAIAVLVLGKSGGNEAEFVPFFESRGTYASYKKCPGQSGNNAAFSELARHTDSPHAG